MFVLNRKQKNLNNGGNENEQNIWSSRNKKYNE